MGELPSKLLSWDLRQATGPSTHFPCLLCVFLSSFCVLSYMPYHAPSTPIVHHSFPLHCPFCAPSMCFYVPIASFNTLSMYLSTPSMPFPALYIPFSLFPYPLCILSISFHTHFEYFDWLTLLTITNQIISI